MIAEGSIILHLPFWEEKQRLHPMAQILTEKIVYVPLLPFFVGLHSRLTLGWPLIFSNLDRGGEG